MPNSIISPDWVTTETNTEEQPIPAEILHEFLEVHSNFGEGLDLSAKARSTFTIETWRAALQLGWSPSSVRKACRLGLLKADKWNGSWHIDRVSVTTLREFIDDQCEGRAGLTAVMRLCSIIDLYNSRAAA